MIATTNQDLKHLVADDRFRDDVHYRLRIVYVVLTSLCERAGDISAKIPRMITRIK